MQSAVPIETIQPERQLQLLLRPVGILTFTTGAGEIGDYLALRFGTTDPEVITQRFHAELSRIADAEVVILGVPNDNGAGFDRGSKKGPLAIRRALLEEGWAPDGVLDIGDVRDHPLLTDDRMLQDWVIDSVREARWGAEGRDLELPVSAHSILDRVLRCLYVINPKLKVMLLGGDHSNSQVPVEVLAEHRKDLGVLQIDAHTDLLETRDGLPTSYATWAFHANEAIGAAGRFVQVGVRVSGTQRGAWEKRLNLHQLWAHEVNALPLQEAVNLTLRGLEEAGVKALYLSHDIDGLSPEYAGATGTPEPGGLTPDFVRALIAAAAERFELIGADLMEVAPTLARNLPGEPHKTIKIAATMVKDQVAALMRRQ